MENQPDSHNQRRRLSVERDSSPPPSGFAYKESASYLNNHESSSGHSDYQVDFGYFRRLSGECDHLRERTLYRNNMTDNPPVNDLRHSRNGLHSRYHSNTSFYARSDGHETKQGDNNFVDVTSIELDSDEDYDGSVSLELSKVQYAAVTSAIADSSRMSPVYRYPLG